MLKIEEMKKFLDYWKKKRDSVKKVLKQFPEGRIQAYTQHVKGREYPYFRLLLPDGSRKSITRDSELIRQYALKMFYEKGTGFAGR